MPLSILINGRPEAVEVAVLHCCDADGQNVRILSSNNDHDNTPWVLPDGRMVFERKFRYGPRRVFLEFPAGKIDAGDPSKSPGPIRRLNI